ncbi:hypothetical protein BDA99DRAFT_69506 [Phascolomyces articulosus]|uniref:Uncharacterized protein n=1 Tax=Phascolomyces articulosus TaxID=60185 RepID=A0AAD5JZD7_9FUNG|nr:hypothetical protein BDA99DRAFT_69506 [Phascolomyces articulosus]
MKHLYFVYYVCFLFSFILYTKILTISPLPLVYSHSLYFSISQYYFFILIYCINICKNPARKKNPLMFHLYIAPNTEQTFPFPYPWKKKINYFFYIYDDDKTNQPPIFLYV